MKPCITWIAESLSWPYIAVEPKEYKVVLVVEVNEYEFHIDVSYLMLHLLSF